MGPWRGPGRGSQVGDLGRFSVFSVTGRKDTNKEGEDGPPGEEVFPGPLSQVVDVRGSRSFRSVPGPPSSTGLDLHTGRPREERGP